MSRSNIKDIGPGYGRVRRNPMFPTAGIMVPFGLYPLAAFPLNAGDTLENLSMSGRFISQPIKHPINGAWFEQWIAAVPLSLINSAFFTDLAPVTTGFTAAADQPRYFTKAGGLDLIKRAYDLVVAEYFTRVGATPPVNDGVTMLPRMGVDWTENLMLKPSALNVSLLPMQGVNTALTGIDLESERALIESSDYRDWVQQFGVKDPARNDIRPRILRYLRNWSLPQNVIDPASGSPRSAFYWSPTLKLEKRMRAPEPTIVLVLGAWRPQMFSDYLPQSYLSRMAGIKEWLPPHNEAAWSPIQGNDPLFKAGFGVVGDNLIFDRSDIWSRGEQFINCLPADSPYPVPVSTSTGVPGGQDQMRGKYPTAADINALFVTTTALKDRCLHYQAMLSTVVLGHAKQVAEATE